MSFHTKENWMSVFDSSTGNVSKFKSCLLTIAGLPHESSTFSVKTNDVFCDVHQKAQSLSHSFKTLRPHDKRYFGIAVARTSQAACAAMPACCARTALGCHMWLWSATRCCRTYQSRLRSLLAFVTRRTTLIFEYDLSRTDAVEDYDSGLAKSRERFTQAISGAWHPVPLTYKVLPGVANKLDKCRRMH